MVFAASGEYGRAHELTIMLNPVNHGSFAVTSTSKGGTRGCYYRCWSAGADGTALLPGATGWMLRPSSEVPRRLRLARDKLYRSSWQIEDWPHFTDISATF